MSELSDQIPLVPGSVNTNLAADTLCTGGVRWESCNTYGNFADQSTFVKLHSMIGAKPG